MIWWFLIGISTLNPFTYQYIHWFKRAHRCMFSSHSGLHQNQFRTPSPSCARDAKVLKLFELVSCLSTWRTHKHFTSHTERGTDSSEKHCPLERVKCVCGKTIVHGFLAAHSQTNKTSEALMVSSSEARIGAPLQYGKRIRGKGEGLRLCKNLWGKVIYKWMRLCIYVWGAVCISEGGKVISLCVKSQMNKVDVWGCVKLKSYLGKTIWFGICMF